MVRYCILCNNHKKTVSYHKFPKDIQIRKKWLQFCNIDETVLNTSTCLCSNHFTKEDYLLTTDNKILKNGSIPCIHNIKSRKKDSSIIQYTADNHMDKLTPSGEKIHYGIADKHMDKLTPSEEKIHRNTDGMSMNITPPNSPRTLHELRYIGDIKSPHLATPRRAKRALNLAKLTIKKQRRQILTLQQTITRMRKRLKTMKDLINHLKKKYGLVSRTMLCSNT